MNQLLLRYKDFLTEADEHYRHATKKHKVRCRKGCSECCATGFFDITLLDALYLHEAMKRVPSPLRKRITAKAEEQLDLLEEKKIFSRREPLLRSVSAINAVCRKSVKMSCPALSEYGRCLIYEYRPHICRIFGPTIRGMRRKVWLKGCRYFAKEIPENDFGMVDLYVEEINLKQELFQKAGRKGRLDIDTIIPAAIALDPGNWIYDYDVRCAGK